MVDYFVVFKSSRFGVVCYAQVHSNLNRYWKDCAITVQSKTFGMQMESAQSVVFYHRILNGPRQKEMTFSSKMQYSQALTTKESKTVDYSDFEDGRFADMTTTIAAALHFSRA